MDKQRDPREPDFMEDEDGRDDPYSNPHMTLPDEEDAELDKKAERPRPTARPPRRRRRGRGYLIRDDIPCTYSKIPRPSDGEVDNKKKDENKGQDDTA